MESNKESQEFWNTKREEAGKDILFKSFARFIGETQTGPIGLSGLLYATEDRVYFEDFEKSSFLDILVKNKKKYQKYTMNFLVSDTAGIRKVSETSAVACMNGEIDEAVAPGALSKLFNNPVWEIKFNSGEAYFFELFEPGELVKLLDK